MKAKTDIVAENDRPQQRIAAAILGLGDRQRGVVPGLPGPRGRRADHQVRSQIGQRRHPGDLALFSGSDVQIGNVQQADRPGTLVEYRQVQPAQCEQPRLGKSGPGQGSCTGGSDRRITTIVDADLAAAQAAAEQEARGKWQAALAAAIPAGGQQMHDTAGLGAGTG